MATEDNKLVKQGVSLLTYDICCKVRNKNERPVLKLSCKQV